MTNKMAESLCSYSELQAVCSKCGKIDSLRKMSWDWEQKEYGGPNLFKGVFCEKCQERNLYERTREWLTKL